MRCSRESRSFTVILKSLPCRQSCCADTVQTRVGASCWNTFESGHKAPSECESYCMVDPSGLRPRSCHTAPRRRRHHVGVVRKEPAPQWRNVTERETD